MVKAHKKQLVTEEQQAASSTSRPQPRSDEVATTGTDKSSQPFRTSRAATQQHQDTQAMAEDEATEEEAEDVDTDEDEDEPPLDADGLERVMKTSSATDDAVVLSVGTRAAKLQLACPELDVLVLWAIADEGHMLKNPTSVIHTLVYRIPRKFLLAVTAAPLLNSLRDMLGYVHLRWRTGWPFVYEKGNAVPSSNRHYTWQNSSKKK